MPIHDISSRELYRSFSTDRADREAHSRELDREIGFKVTEIETDLIRRAREVRPEGHLWSLGQGLHNGSQTWIGLDPETIQTPYDELAEIILNLELTGTEKVLDLGAGYGRMGLVLHAFYPGCQFEGIELVPERVAEGNRIFEAHQIHGHLFVSDLSDPDFILPDADVYFLYDFGELPHIRNILRKLPDQKKFQLIARGKGSRNLIDLEFPWLSDVYPVKRFDNYAIYSSFALPDRAIALTLSE